MNIEIISGSPRTESISHRVALFLLDHFKKNTTHHVAIIDVRDPVFPPVQKVFPNANDVPPELKDVAERIFAADAFIMVSPEYNGSYAPAMKNLLDHFPKQVHKVFGIVTTSTGPMGGIRASQQMQLLINGLFGVGCPFMLVVPQVDKKFDAQGNLTDAAFTNTVHTFVTEFLWLAERISVK